jgi:hypothetical protein
LAALFFLHIRVLSCMAFVTYQVVYPQSHPQLKRLPGLTSGRCQRDMVSATTQNTCMTTNDTVRSALVVKRFAPVGDCGETLRPLRLSRSATSAQPRASVRRDIWCVINSALCPCLNRPCRSFLLLPQTLPFLYPVRSFS